MADQIILSPKTLSTLPVATELLARDRIVGLRSPIDEPDKSKRNILLPPSLFAGGSSVFPANEPVFATGFGNLPAGYAPAGKNVLEVLRQAGSQPYLFPSFASFTIQDAGSQTVEVGTQFPAGFKSFKWSINNSDNLADNATITIVDETANSTLVTGTPNDGVQSLSTAAFSTANGLSRRYRISTVNDKGDTLTGALEIYGSYRLFYGPTASPSTTSTQARGLLDSRLLSTGNQFILDSGVTQRFFEVDVPPGKTIVSVVDLDNLNQVITGDYVASALSVNDIGGTPRAYTRYVKTQAVPYTTNHRHQITLS